MRALLAALLLSTALIASPAFAQSKKELAAQNAQLAQRLSTLESRMLTGDPAAERLMQRMDALEMAQRSLTGEIERLQYERDTLRGEVEALAGDLAAMQALSDRMELHLNAVDLVAREQSQPNIPSSPYAPRTYGGDDMPGTDPGVMASDGTQISQVPGAPVFREQTIGVQEQYNDLAQLPDKGRQMLAEGDYLGAQTAFKQYLEFNPDAPDAGEINFWLGETYYVRGGYADAADAYITSMRKDGKGVKAPNAMVRLASSLRELGNRAEACQTFATFPGQFPNAAESVKEQARIEQTRTGC